MPRSRLPILIERTEAGEGPPSSPAEEMPSQQDAPAARDTYDRRRPMAARETGSMQNGTATALDAILIATLDACPHRNKKGL